MLFAGTLGEGRGEGAASFRALLTVGRTDGKISLCLFSVCRANRVQMLRFSSQLYLDDGS